MHDAGDVLISVTHRNASGAFSGGVNVHPWLEALLSFSRPDYSQRRVWTGSIPLARRAGT